MGLCENKGACTSRFAQPHSLSYNITNLSFISNILSKRKFVNQMIFWVFQSPEVKWEKKSNKNLQISILGGFNFGLGWTTGNFENEFWGF
jgi:hypothetical protein